MLLLLVISTQAIKAESISETEASAIAERFFTSRALGHVVTKKAVHKARMQGATAEKAAYYVFNTTEKNAWVMVAGDDCADQILAYGDEGAWDASNVPSNVQWWLNMYAAQIAALAEAGEGSAVAKAKRVATKRAIRPMLKSKWDQGTPFNNLCPTVNQDTCLTGCVATAMAQIMYYHKGPQSVPALPSYTSDIEVPAWNATTLNWDAMKDFYTADEKGTSADAVAALMRCCGQAVKMSYGVDASGASAYIANAFVNIFKYSPKARNVMHDYVGNEEWEKIIYSELSAKRPVLLAGSKLSGGHEFVCDGYDGEGLYHINWGWRGSYNGYYQLHVLCPQGGGSGSISGADGYVRALNMLIGIEPNTESNAVNGVVVNSVSVTTPSLIRQSFTDNFTDVQVSCGFYNLMGGQSDCVLGWALYDGDELLQVLDYGGISDWGYLYGCSYPATLSFGAGIGPGTYRIVPVVSDGDESGPWYPADGSDVTYIEAKIEQVSRTDKGGKGLTLTPKGSADSSSGALETNYTLNYTALTEEANPNKNIEVMLNLTNNGTVDFGTIYMTVNGSLATVAATNVKPGESDDVYLHFKVTATGSYTLKFYTDEDCENELGSMVVNVNNAASASLTASFISLDDLDRNTYTVDSDIFHMKVRINNTGSSEYRDQIRIRLIRKIENSQYGNLYGVKIEPVSIAAGGSIPVECEFKELPAGDYYVSVEYYSVSDYAAAAVWGYFHLTGKETVTLLPGDVNGDGEVNVTDAVALANYVMGDIPETFYFEAADLNGDEDVNVSDVVALANIVMGT